MPIRSKVLSSAEGLHDEDFTFTRDGIGKCLSIFDDDAVDEDCHVSAQGTGVFENVAAQRGTLAKVSLQDFRDSDAVDRGGFRNNVPLQIGCDVYGSHEVPRISQF